MNRLQIINSVFVYIGKENGQKGETTDFIFNVTRLRIISNNIRNQLW